jgi:hypothetical protein
MAKTKRPRKVFTENEWIAGRHAFLSWSLRKIADHCKKCEYDPDQIISFLREISDEHEAQEIVVKLRDELLKITP